MSTIGTRLRTARIKAGMTQQELAEATGVGRARICNLERDYGGERTTVRIDTLMKLCRALKVSPRRLLPDEKLAS